MVEVSDGEAGFQYSLDKHPDSILLDAILPFMNGFEVLQKLKSNPATSAGLVIMVSTRAKSKTSIPQWIPKRRITL